MRLAIVLSLLALPFVISLNAQAATSDWLSAPKPKFPARALQKGAEGSVKLRIVLAKDGSVTSATVLKSTGDSVLDEAARNAVLKWRMKPSAIKPSDLAKGRDEVVEFKQEALVAAVYPDRRAFFAHPAAVDTWMFAPFPAYPLDARRLHHTGTVLLGVRIGSDGRVVDVQSLQSSGHADLDELAIRAVRLWRAHKKFAGQGFKVPVQFVIGRRPY